MDAREQLRKYLEQRRELGERELVLDSLSAEEALRLIAGAPPGLKTVSTASAAPAPRDANSAPGSNEDWRETLRAAGVTPPAPRDSATPKTPQSMPGAGTPSASTSVPSGSATPLADLPAGLSVGGGIESFAGGVSQLQSLDAIAQTISSCTRCSLSKTALNGVPGEGNSRASLMLVGEAPGATEDETGRPFVGAAGQLLTKILSAINLAREEVFICNVLKHRPPNNRNPEPDEVTACSPYLVRQIALIQPRVIIALGKFAAQTLLSSKLSVDKLRGQIHRYHGVPLIVTYHPAALLRNPSWKRPTWEDVQLARRILDSSG